MPKRARPLSSPGPHASGQTPHEPELVAGMKSMGAAMGIILAAAEIQDNLSSIDDVIKSVAQDDQLTDDELELIAGGGEKKESSPRARP